MNWTMRAIQSLRPDVEFTLNDNDISTIVWSIPNVSPLTQSEVDAEAARLEAEANQSVVDRAAALASAEAKLATLGLSTAEIAALFSK
jgi:hypothetical protein